MALYDVKPRFRALLEGLLPALQSVSPDAITLAGLLCSLAAAALFQNAEAARWPFLVIPVLLLFSPPKDGSLKLFPSLNCC